MFKYYSFSEYSVSSVINNEIYMNHYASFNDPFECWGEVVTGFPCSTENSQRLQAILDAWGYGSIPLIGSEKQQYEEYSDSLLGMEPNVKDAIRAARISCFSKRADNLLMWSHYANGLRGFCIEFDEALIVEQNDHMAEIYEVSYKETPPIIDTALIAMLTDQIDYHSDVIHSAKNDEEAESYNEWLEISITRSNDIYKKMLATKPKNWEYEEEIRLIYQSMSIGLDGEFYSYPKKAVKAVIFGEKMPEKQQQVLRNVFKQYSHDIEFKMAKRIKGEFKVQLESCI
ncbi:DUF2971 domain-containing protein [Aliivibrio finisterrensis]|uniref:DUF2971 domain-containing protein n=3 Tax=Aliivibrio TaxID=511678 RepID=A0A4Q5KN36_9GAMM|nr:DUF2971 domain-containing protein [Aliivibrio finisterrensis]RYU47785.1 DUF2971 domain-containing protein [Aliivibrio finisterrensis]RYU52345.1 DUF2971 domain-containing protein [Aliivibrio finisterrensis]RYU78441.1 DUF2971 domain-containing protein [Aliivibrio finisterrensis]